MRKENNSKWYDHLWQSCKPLRPLIEWLYFNTRRKSMKLSEVIKAIEDGSKSKFTNGVYEIAESSTFNYAICIESIAGFHNTNLSKDGWQEIKPPRQWSEKELMLFKLLPEWAKWIATDEDGTICVYENEPNISKSGDFHQVISDNHDYEELDVFDFLTITFEESPVYIGDLKGE